MTTDRVVHVIDDDADVRQSLAFLQTSAGLTVRMHDSALAFLDVLPEIKDGCVVTDVRMPGMDGLELQRRLRQLKARLPVIVMTGHGDVETARQAFLAQAVDFLEKPIDHDKLLRAIHEAFSRQRASQESRLRQSEGARLLATLTPREKEVMDEVVAGRHNREIALALDISPRTVEVHTARLLAKLRVSSIADLVRLSLQGRDAGQD